MLWRNLEETDAGICGQPIRFTAGKTYNPLGTAVVDAQAVAWHGQQLYRGRQGGRRRTAHSHLRRATGIPLSIAGALASALPPLLHRNAPAIAGSWVLSGRLRPHHRESEGQASAGEGCGCECASAGAGRGCMQAGQQRGELPLSPGAAPPRRCPCCRSYRRPCRPCPRTHRAQPPRGVPCGRRARRSPSGRAAPRACLRAPSPAPPRAQAPTPWSHARGSSPPRARECRAPIVAIGTCGTTNERTMQLHVLSNPNPQAKHGRGGVAGRKAAANQRVVLSVCREAPKWSGATREQRASRQRNSNSGSPAAMPQASHVFV
eukprot:gene5344-biopygen5723